MKLTHMHIENFGTLHKYDYDFQEGLNIILQDNGWGKTTMAAFLKAMLYGFGSKRSRDITENERKRYYPWQGGSFGGSLDFEAGGTNYRITREFGGTPRYDKVKIRNLDTGTTAKIDPEKIGETLFHLDANAFQRSVFINQNGLSMNGASSSIHARLNALVSQANDVAAYDGAIADLTQQIKVYEKMGGRGQLGEIMRSISARESERDQLDSIISEQDKNRERITEIDIILGIINRDLRTKKNELDKVSGEEKEREANRKVISDIKHKIDDLQIKIDELKTDLGGRIPSNEEIDHIKRQRQSIKEIEGQLERLTAEYDSLTAEYRKLLDEYGGNIPTYEQLDKIQSVYGEYSGLVNTKEAHPDNIASASEAYQIVNNALITDRDYVDKLSVIINDDAVCLQELIRQLDDQKREIEKDKLTFDQTRQQYFELKRTAKEAQEKYSSSRKYSTEEVAPVIKQLEEIQKIQQYAEIRKESLNKTQLSDAEEKLLADYSGHLQDETEGNEMLSLLQGAQNKKAEAQRLTSRLEGETTKLESINVSISQVDTIADVAEGIVNKPEKPSGTIMAAGGVLLALGCILAIMVNPVMAVLAVAGAAIMFIGINSNKRYNDELQKYEKSQELSRQYQDAQERRNSLQKQALSTQTIIQELKDQITLLNQEAEKEMETVTSWVEKCGQPDRNVSISESAIIDILNHNKQVEAILAKKAEADVIREQISSQSMRSNALWEEACKKYPDIINKDVFEALEHLRSVETDSKIDKERLDAAIEELNKYLSNSNFTEKEFESGESVLINEKTKAFNKKTLEVREGLEKINDILALIGLKADRKNVAEVIRKAEQLLNEYTLNAEKANGYESRQKQKQLKEESLLRDISSLIRQLHSPYGCDVSEINNILPKIREDIESAKKLSDKRSQNEATRNAEKARKESVDQAISLFNEAYCKFNPASEDPFSEICFKTEEVKKMETAKGQLLEQCAAIEQKTGDVQAQASTEDAVLVETLKKEVDELNNTRDELRDEYTQKSDMIRHADEALERYPEVSQIIRQLYDQKQKALNKLSILKRAISLITKAKENLANRYLSRVETLFNDYMQIWMDNDAIRGILDIDFKVSIEENNKVHTAEGYSTAYCDMIDFCMRLALVDTLFEEEQPFLILDDPFVSLDSDHLEKALELVDVMSANKQIIYFVCHPIRAAEATESTLSREDLVRISNETRDSLKRRRSEGTSTKTTTIKSPKELYKVRKTSFELPFSLKKPNYKITNSIFSLNFVMSDAGINRDTTYELFFIDEKGRVLNERQILEIKNGKLSTERVQFCLNTREDSGTTYELMVRESGQEDYEVDARIPFKANLAFAGTFGFGF